MDFALVFGSVIVGAFITWMFGIVNEQRKEKKVTRHKLNFLLTELQENKLVIEDPHMAGGIAFARFQSSAWNAVKGETQPLDSRLSENLRLVYSKLSRYNDMVEHFNSTGDGRLKPAMKIYMDEIKTVLDDCLTELKQQMGRGCWDWLVGSYRRRVA